MSYMVEIFTPAGNKVCTNDIVQAPIKQLVEKHGGEVTVNRKGKGEGSESLVKRAVSNIEMPDLYPRR